MAERPENKYVALMYETVDTIKQGIIVDTAIDTGGYSEIRVFIHVFAESYEKFPFQPQSTIKARLDHCPFNKGTWHYSEKEMKIEVTSYLHGWWSEKIIGDKVRLIAFAHEFP